MCLYGMYERDIVAAERTNRFKDLHGGAKARPEIENLSPGEDEQ